MTDDCVPGRCCLRILPALASRLCAWAQTCRSKLCTLWCPRMSACRYIQARNLDRAKTLTSAIRIVRQQPADLIAALLSRLFSPHDRASTIQAGAPSASAEQLPRLQEAAMQGPDIRAGSSLLRHCLADVYLQTRGAGRLWSLCEGGSPWYPQRHELQHCDGCISLNTVALQAASVVLAAMPLSMRQRCAGTVSWSEQPPEDGPPHRPGEDPGLRERLCLLRLHR